MSNTVDVILSNSTNNNLAFEIQATDKFFVKAKKKVIVQYALDDLPAAVMIRKDTEGMPTEALFKSLNTKDIVKNEILLDIKELP